ncbi:unnamed protein product [Bursaphelenchus xylophilus]|uniref:(pine wood nematode) hypothetical protein n=1 Tax=Bursaphelenchus xylophilus TaxID=6326 RepID=A0A1I7RJC8_BURXY|nr:unnamed protein product [Bursaphelenchus xylophilus]CAG9128792.1 unnamed protein product [Bursaphelenchus xylophilus]
MFFSRIAMSLGGKVALVTGASRGIGKGIAVELGKAGATVYVTGRRPEQSDKAVNQTTLEQVAQEISAGGGKGKHVYVDHSDPKSVKELFEQISTENKGQLDILVNNAYAAANFILKNTSKKFWEIDADPAYAYDVINNVGLRNHYVCLVHAARLMVPRKSGLVVNIGSLGGISYFLNVAYGIGKGGIDRLSSDAATELAGTGVTVVSLWPGAVKTEMIQNMVLKEKNDSAVYKYFDEGESIYYPGKCIVKLATLPDLNKHSGEIITTTNLAKEFQIKDEDGHLPVDPNVVKNMDYINQMNAVRTKVLKSSQ